MKYEILEPASREVSSQNGANEEGGEDEMTEPANEGDEIADSFSDKDGVDTKLNRKSSILSPMKGANNNEDSSVSVTALKISRKESLKE